MIDNTKFMRNGPAFENHHSLDSPMGICENEKTWNIQQGWRHHADLPLPGVQKSQSKLFIMAQPRQGSWRVRTWRK